QAGTLSEGGRTTATPARDHPQGEHLRRRHLHNSQNRVGEGRVRTSGFEEASLIGSPFFTSEVRSCALHLQKARGAINVTDSAIHKGSAKQCDFTEPANTRPLRPIRTRWRETKSAGPPASQIGWNPAHLPTTAPIKLL